MGNNAFDCATKINKESNDFLTLLINKCNEIKSFMIAPIMQDDTLPTHQDKRTGLSFYPLEIIGS